nr:Transposon Tn7 transposition protein TnsC [Paraburkholderia busanensis]
MATKLDVNDALRIAYGRNPILDALGPPFKIDGFPQALSHRPLDLIPWRKIMPQDRIELLDLIKSHFTPTRFSIELAFRLQLAIRRSYRERNPLLAANRRKLYEVGSWQGREISELPWFARNAQGIVLQGITGLGKSTMYQRFLDLLPQVIPHGPDAEAGWTALDQLVYLVVPMSADKSRMGFLHGFLQEIDRALGNTDYYKQYASKSKMTVEKMLVIVAIILHTHHCGLLVIEEIQSRSFAPGDQRAVLLIFFLRLLNLGIPTLLVGNPNGFVGFGEFSQDVRRLYSAGNFELWPADGEDVAEWVDDYVNPKLHFNLLPFEVKPTPELLGAFVRRSGGVAGYFDTLWITVQENWLRGTSGHRRSISVQDIEAAYLSPTMSANSPLIEALTGMDVLALTHFSDVPSDKFAIHWAGRSGTDLKKEPDHPVVSNAVESLRAAVSSSRFQKADDQLAAKAKRTAKKNTASAVRETEESPDDRLAKSIRESLKKEADILEKTLKSKEKINLS